MFYLKNKSDEAEVKIYYTGENCFTECSACGKEIQINIEEFLEPGNIDLLSTEVMCGGCVD